jgi:hypothetical protein
MSRLCKKKREHFTHSVMCVAYKMRSPKKIRRVEKDAVRFVVKVAVELDVMDNI